MSGGSTTSRSSRCVPNAPSCATRMSRPRRGHRERRARQQARLPDVRADDDAHPCAARAARSELERAQQAAHLRDAQVDDPARPPGRRRPAELAAPRSMLSSRMIAGVERERDAAPCPRSPPRAAAPRARGTRNSSAARCVDRRGRRRSRGCWRRRAPTPARCPAASQRTAPSRGRASRIAGELDLEIAESGLAVARRAAPSNSLGRRVAEDGRIAKAAGRAAGSPSSASTGWPARLAEQVEQRQLHRGPRRRDSRRSRGVVAWTQARERSRRRRMRSSQSAECAATKACALARLSPVTYSRGQPFADCPSSPSASALDPDRLRRRARRRGVLEGRP